MEGSLRNRTRIERMAQIFIRVRGSTLRSRLAVQASPIYGDFSQTTRKPTLMHRVFGEFQLR
jgi:hypothetical protein